MRVTPDPVPSQTVSIVESDDGDAILIQELLDEARSPFHSTVVRTVAAALAVPVPVDVVILALPAEDAPGIGSLALVRNRRVR